MKTRAELNKDKHKKIETEQTKERKRKKRIFIFKLIAFSIIFITALFFYITYVANLHIIVKENRIISKKIPSNFNIVFSSWDRSWKVPNPYNLPVSYVRFKDQTLNPTIPEDAFECTGHCSTCYKCWHLKNSESVVFHQH